MVATVPAPAASPPLLRRLEGRLVAALHRGIATHYLRKPELSELLEIKFPDVRAVAWAAANELAFRFKSQRSARVLSLNVETTNYCNLRCTICPVNRGMVRQKRWLDPALFRSLIDRTPTLRFVLPFQWGEPLLHSEIDAMVRYAADRGIRSMLTTNGTLLDDAMAERLLASGLDRLTVSVDGDDATHERIRDFPLRELRERVALLKRRRDAGRHRLRIDVSMVLDDATRPALDRYRAEWKGIADRVQVIPCLAAGPRRNACRELWRGSLVVLVDGTVTACCADSEGALALGNALRDAPDRILNDAPFRALRLRHKCGDFPEPCRSCSEFDGRDVGVHARFDA